MQGLDADTIHGFSSGLLLKNFDNPKDTPDFHHELWELVCSESPRVAVAAPRGHAKSTAVTLVFILACVLFRIKKHVLLISDTESQSVDFLGDIKKELIENEDLKELFGVRKIIKDKETQIIVELQKRGDERFHPKFRIIAKGSEQKLRGIKWRNTRPDLIVCDDLENDEIVESEDRRTKFRKWFFKALMQCGGDTCDVRVVGTILHMDSLLERFMPSWTDEQTETNGIKYWSTRKKTWTAVRYQAHNEDYSKLLWADKFPKERLVTIRNEFIEDGDPEGYSQEYLNYPIDLENAFYRVDDLLPIPEEDKQAHGDYYAAADLAISEKEKAAYTVIVVGKLIHGRKLDIVDVIRFRTRNSRKIINALFAVQYRYEPLLFGIEAENIAKSLGPIIKEEMGMDDKHPYINIEELPPIKDKEKRARPAQAKVKAGDVRFNQAASWWPTLLEELSQFPKSKFLDQADAFAWLVFMINKMVDVKTTEEIKEEEYDIEVEQAYGTTDWGVSQITGY